MTHIANDGAVDGLSEALRIYLERKSGAVSESDEQFLQRHADLREVLEPLVAQDSAATRGIRAGETLGDYRLIEVIGRGGMGEVWEAEQLSLKRRVAFKILNNQTFGSLRALQRFRREALAGARIKHPCVVAVYAVGEHAGVNFIAQELIETRRTLSMLLRDLRDLREQPVLPSHYWRETAERFARLAEALQVAHDAGVIHRDIKPSNILLAADGAPKIADFGLALVEDALELSCSGELSGSPFYMSPEQANAKSSEIDARSDVFSLGATLYEALTLSRPFDGDTVSQVLHKILVVDPPDPREVRSLCPRDLAVICLKMLEKDRARRYASMGELALDLRRFLDNKPILARAAGPAVRISKWCRRHPVRAASSAIVGAALVIVSTLLVENHRARKAAEGATLQALDAERTAKREALTSGRVVDFLLDAFDASRPDVARGHVPSVRDVLDRGVERIQRELTDPAQAGPRARLLESLGMVYSRLGYHREAEALLREARALAAATFGATDERTLNIADELVRVLKSLARPRDAMQIARELWEANCSRHGPESGPALRAEGNLAHVEQAAGELDDAERHLRHSISGRERLHLTTAAGVLNLGDLLRARGQMDEARTMVERAIAAYTAEIGADAPDTLTAMDKLARIEGLTGNMARACELVEATLEMRLCVEGPTHPDTLITQGQLAVNRLAEDAHASIAELRRLHAIALATLGPSDSTTVNLAVWLGSSLTRVGNDKDGESFLIAAVEGASSSGSQVASTNFAALQALGDVERRLGRGELGVALLQEALDISLCGALPAPQLVDILMDRIVEAQRALDHDADALTTARDWLARTPAQHPDFERRADLVEQLEASVADH